MTSVAVLLSAAVFFWLFRRLDVLGLSRGALADGAAGFSALADRTLSDDEKERLARAASLRLLRLAGVLIFWTVVAIAPSAIILLAFVWSGLTTVASLLSLSEAWWVWLLFVLGFAVDIAWRRHAR